MENKETIRAQKEVVRAVLEYASVSGRSVLFAFVDEEGDSGSFISPDKTKFIHPLGDPRHAGFLSKLANLLTIVFSAKKLAVVN